MKADYLKIIVDGMQHNNVPFALLAFDDDGNRQNDNYWINPTSNVNKDTLIAAVLSNVICQFLMDGHSNEEIKDLLDSILENACKYFEVSKIPC